MSQQGKVHVQHHGMRLVWAGWLRGELRTLTGLEELHSCAISRNKCRNATPLLLIVRPTTQLACRCSHVDEQQACLCYDDGQLAICRLVEILLCFDTASPDLLLHINNTASACRLADELYKIAPPLAPLRTHIHRLYSSHYHETLSFRQLHLSPAKVLLQLYVYAPLQHCRLGLVCRCA